MWAGILLGIAVAAAWRLRHYRPWLIMAAAALQAANLAAFTLGAYTPSEARNLTMVGAVLFLLGLACVLNPVLREMQAVHRARSQRLNEIFEIIEWMIADRVRVTGGEVDLPSRWRAAIGRKLQATPPGSFEQLRQQWIQAEERMAQDLRPSNPWRDDVAVIFYCTAIVPLVLLAMMLFRLL